MSDFNIISFLEEYQRYPCLWLKKDPNYKLRHKRDAAEEALLAFTKLPNIKQLRQKIRSIRCTYNQETAKVRSSMVTGSGKHDVYVPKLSWFTLADSFLKKNNEGQRESDSNFAIPSQELENTTLAINNSDVSNNSDVLNNVASQSMTQNIIQTTTTTRKRTKKQSGQTSNKHYDQSLDKAVNTLKFVCEQKSKTNEFIIFGQYVAAQLEKLPLEESILLQEKIQNLLTKARLDEISRSASSTALLTKIVHNETNYDYDDNNVIEEVEFEDEPETSHDNNISESNNIAVYYNNFM
ncbi:uncharacterized protein LOC111042900 [Myzus persicae]|uniref:uncharacterized protein LOC111042900 n=1 Tax=Myzus persicae TaxID=13164 RepID=UPI000B93994B|nr:uncharacterized protein LOC111042900 [Myzus persicae]